MLNLKIMQCTDVDLLFSSFFFLSRFCFITCKSEFIIVFQLWDCISIVKGPIHKHMLLLRGPGLCIVYLYHVWLYELTVLFCQIKLNWIELNIRPKTLGIRVLIFPLFTTGKIATLITSCLGLFCTSSLCKTGNITSNELKPMDSFGTWYMS